MRHTHTHQRVSRNKLFWTILFNLGITLAEFIGGLLSGYLALLADAVHNLSDVAALGLAWLGVKGSEMPATKRSTYGFKRLEVLTALLSASALVIIAVFILVEAYSRFLAPVPITRPVLFLTVAVIGLIGNLFSIWLLHSEKGKSLNMKSAFLHMAYDAISSVAVIAGGIVIILTGWVIVDVLLSAMIALMIFWSSWLVIKEAVLIFLEAVPSGLDFDAIAAEIGNLALIAEVHDLHIWSLSSNEAALSCHIVLSPDNLSQGPRIVDKVNQILLEKFSIGHCTIQVDSEDCRHTDLLCNYTENDKAHSE